MIRNVNYAFIIMFLLFFHFHFYHTNLIKKFDYTFYDFLTIFINKKSVMNNSKASSTIIVDIDEKSLDYFGQWPWPRIIDAQLINKINSFYPSAIAINILFPELDRTSPKAIENFYNNFFNLKVKFNSSSLIIKDNDNFLTKAVENANGILSIYFTKNLNSSKNCENLSYKNNLLSTISTPLQAPYILCNHKKLQNSIKNFGFINASADNDGIFRRLNLFISHNNKIFPSFGLATLLSIDENLEIIKKNQFKILGHKVKTNSDSSVLINFYIPKPKVISVVDIMSGKTKIKDFQGKIIIIGSSVIGLNPTYRLSNNKKISNSMIHAFLIENILKGLLHTQPKIYKKINIFLSLFLSFIVLILLFNRLYIYIFILFFTTILISFLYLFLFYINGIYVSIGYLWSPFIIYFFTVTLFFIIINTKDKNKFYKELMESHSSTVESIALISAIRDDETGEHLKRTKIYIKELAEYLLSEKHYTNILNEKYINLIYQAAPLHDIGKLGIPDNILKKPGKLTFEEYEIMKQHPVLAKNAIEKAMRYYDKNSFLNIAYNIAYYHHERWNGNGYPIGLKGDKIPLEAQLMAIADVYDALVTKRCYKDSFSFKEAEDIIIGGSGTDYNPIIIDAFKALKYRFRDISREYRDNYSEA